MQTLVITAGEPAGIGPDIVLQLAQQSLQHPWFVIADKSLLAKRAEDMGLAITLRECCHPLPLAKAGELYVKHLPLRARVEAGKLNADNARYVLDTLETAATLCMQNGYALVTGPVQKSVINEAGFPFTGHTEFFANFAEQTQVVMLLAGPTLRVALLTTHIPLGKVTQCINKNYLQNALHILHNSLQNQFAIARPHIIVLGLNPHAGEQGHLGQEEITIIKPVITACQEQGMDCIGPLPADTAFTEKHRTHCDAYLAMYHDQGLPVIKTLDFSHIVNITLGLPFIRTSVDHGTALDLAGTGKASYHSLLAAYECAATLLKRN